MYMCLTLANIVLACHVNISITIIEKLVTRMDIILLRINSGHSVPWLLLQLSGLFNFSCAGVGGEWRIIAKFNITAGDKCPNGWRDSS